MISRDVFLRTVGDVMKKMNLDRIDILRKLPVFAGWSTTSLASLYKNFTKLELRFKSTVYEEEKEDDNLYVVLKGEVEVATDYFSC